MRHTSLRSSCVARTVFHALGHSTEWTVGQAQTVRKVSPQSSPPLRIPSIDQRPTVRAEHRPRLAEDPQQLHNGIERTQMRDEHRPRADELRELRELPLARGRIRAAGRLGRREDVDRVAERLLDELALRNKAQAEVRHREVLAREPAGDVGVECAAREDGGAQQRGLARETGEADHADGVVRGEPRGPSPLLVVQVARPSV